MSKLSSKIDRKFINSIELNDWEIETDTGWEEVTHIHQTIPYQKWRIQTENGLILECADDHIVFDADHNEIFVKDLIPYQSYIQTKVGIQLIANIERLEVYENMFDMTVNSPNHRFYTNDILSHNSSVITALIFGLYGKSNRGTTKKQLVNSVNKKDCLVEVEFSNDGKRYKVRRGISPNIFEIYINEKLQEELSASRDQQKFLEQTILKMSYKTFMQVVVLGSNNYVPFMELSAADRRDLVEELLDIKIFSTMNILLKDKIKSIEKDQRELSSEKKTIEISIENQKTLIDSIKENGKETINRREDDISSLQKENEECFIRVENEKKRIDALNGELDELDFYPKRGKQISNLFGKIQEKRNSLSEEIEFFTHNEVCHTCKQNVDDDFKEDRISKLQINLQELVDGEKEIISEIEREEKREKEYKRLSNDITSHQSLISKYQSQVNLNNRQIQKYQKEIQEIQINIENQEENIKKLQKLIRRHKKIEKQESQCNQVLEYFEFSHLLMKDGGIKSKIIENYLPVINSQINKYLQMLDLYLNFTLDNEFKETVKTPIHEDFSYGSFSEGEKQRINLSLLLAWRDVAKMKNSVNCNIMFFDETLDSSLDGAGIEDLLKIINYVVKDSNVFVISHRDGYDDKFQRTIEVKKINGFTKLFT
jgi:DNA repair exonuclease SbcCD ATPase subunit